MEDDGSIPWHSKYERCAECGTRRYSHKAKGYCFRCYPFVRKIVKLKETGTLKVDDSRHMFAHQTARIEIEIAQRHLQNLRELEDPFVHGVRGEHICGLLTTLARITGASSNGAAQYLETGRLWNSCLSDEAKQWLYLILVDIVEHLPSRKAREMRMT